MSRWIEIKTKDGHCYDAYFCEAQGNSFGSIILLHEIFGITDWIKNICQEWAKKGFHTLVPALYDRLEKNIAFSYDQEGYQKALQYKQNILTLQNKEGIAAWVLQLYDIAAAKKYLQDHFTKAIGIIGFSWGGTLGWLAATRLTGIMAVSAYYGTHIYQFCHEKPQCPVMLHCGEKDDLLTLKQVQEIKQKNPATIVYTYPATHGFHCNGWNNVTEQINQKFDKQASQQADQKTQEFLKKNLQHHE